MQMGSTHHVVGVGDVVVAVVESEAEADDVHHQNVVIIVEPPVRCPQRAADGESDF